MTEAELDKVLKLLEHPPESVSSALRRPELIEECIALREDVFLLRKYILQELVHPRVRQQLLKEFKLF